VAAAEGARCRTGTLRERALGGAHVDYNNVQRYYTITLLLSTLPISTMSAQGTPDPAAAPGYMAAQQRRSEPDGAARRQLKGRGAERAPFPVVRPAPSVVVARVAARVRSRLRSRPRGEVLGTSTTVRVCHLSPRLQGVGFLTWESEKASFRNNHAFRDPLAAPRPPPIPRDTVWPIT
jgi:hypothetical protein